MDFDKLYHLIFIAFCEKWGETQKRKSKWFIFVKQKTAAEYWQQEANRKRGYSIGSIDVLQWVILILLAWAILLAFVIGNLITVYTALNWGVGIELVIALLIMKQESKNKFNHSGKLYLLEKDWHESEHILQSRAEHLTAIISEKISGKYRPDVLIDFLLEKCAEEKERKNLNGLLTGWILPVLIFMLSSIGDQISAVNFLLKVLLLFYITYESLKVLWTTRQFSRVTKHKVYLNAFEDTLRYIKLRNLI